MRVRKAAPVLENRGGAASRFAHLEKVAGEFGSFRPATEVLTRVRAVPTIFPAFDYATRVGGLPIERFTLLHGPSAGGKSYFCIGLMLSFLLRDHPVYFVDAERTTPEPWLKMAMGEYANHPLFRADKPDSYEQTKKDVRAFLLRVKKLRDAGKLAPDTSALVVVDSIRKLVPKDQFDTIMREVKAAKDGADLEKARTRINQIKAAMNAAWLDELVVLLDETKTAMVAIAREMVDPDAPPPPRAFGGRKPEPAMKTGGGGALFYDASLDLRVKRLKAYGKDGEKFVAYGDLHAVEITKSKVSGKETNRYESAAFHISNGTWTPAGFDRARDLVEIARRFDVVEGTGWLKYGRRKWRSADLAVKAIADDAALFAEIEKTTRALFRKEATR